MNHRSELNTEKQNPKSDRMNNMSLTEILIAINNDDAKIANQVKNVIPEIKDAVKYTIRSIKKGGRVFYVGAGTSGRLGVLDASEIPPTFSAEDNLFIGLIAGGDIALRNSVEGAEDISQNAVEDLLAYTLDEKDTLIGISCSGAAAYVISALNHAKSKSSKTVYLTTNPKPLLKTKVDVLINLDTGPEIIAGSTRMKAGTATKMVLNMISTSTMIKVGKVYNNLMVDLKAINKKLIDRGTRIISQLTELDYNKAKEKLIEADYSVKVAIVMELKNCSLIEAKNKLDRVDGFLNLVIDE